MRGDHAIDEIIPASVAIEHRIPASLIVRSCVMY
jgi:hypothetical protein